MKDGQFIILHPYIPQNPMPGGSTIFDGLDPPHELLIKKIPYRLAYWQSDKVIFSVEFLWS